MLKSQQKLIDYLSDLQKCGYLPNASGIIAKVENADLKTLKAIKESISQAINATETIKKQILDKLFEQQKEGKLKDATLIAKVEAASDKLFYVIQKISQDIQKAKKEPFEWKAEHNEKYGMGKSPYPFPTISNPSEVKGWKHVADHFVDHSGFGREGEPALTIRQFHSKLKPGKGYAITDVGQFQLHIGEYDKEVKKTEQEDVPLEAGGKLKRPRPLAEAPIIQKPKEVKKADDEEYDYKGYKYILQPRGEHHFSVEPKNFKTRAAIVEEGKDKAHASFKQYIDRVMHYNKSDNNNDDEDEPWSYSQKNIQRMIDDGSVWHMEGSMGRHAMDLINAGHVILGPKGHKDFWGNYVPAHHEVKPGTKGSPEYAKKLTGYIHPDHIKKGVIRGIPDGTGPHGQGAGPGKGKADGTGLKVLQTAKKIEDVKKVKKSDESRIKIKFPGSLYHRELYHSQTGDHIYNIDEAYEEAKKQFPEDSWEIFGGGSGRDYEPSKKKESKKS